MRATIALFLAMSVGAVGIVGCSEEEKTPGPGPAAPGVDAAADVLSDVEEADVTADVEIEPDAEVDAEADAELEGDAEPEEET